MKTSTLSLENDRYRPWLDMIWRLGRAAEERGGRPGNHGVRVGYASRAIARSLGLADRSVEALFLTAPLHDIGKIRIPERIVGKRGPLSSDEWAAMRQHCSIGARIVRESPRIGSILLNLASVFSPSAVASGASYLRKLAALIVLQHHERWDANGYPQGLDGTEISLESRIVAVADAFDAMTSNRPYRPAYPEEWALETIYEAAGSQFDPAVCDAFVKALPQIRSMRCRFAEDPRACPATESLERLLVTP